MLSRVCMTQQHHDQLFSHLHPGDGLEAVALALCGRQKTPCGEERLLVREIFPIPYSKYSVRSANRVTWDTRGLIKLINKALPSDLGIIKIHSHPAGYEEFSSFDDESDKQVFTTVFNALESERPHGSLISLPNGRYVGRGITPSLTFNPLERISIIGDLISHHELNPPRIHNNHSIRTIQAFGDGTYQKLRRLKVAVIGVSGTGSLVAEQLARTGVGHILLIDPKEVNSKNLNRIPYTTSLHAQNKTPKVQVLKNAIENSGLGTKVEIIQGNIFNEDIQRLVAACDVVFGCMDTADGRNLLNRIATFYLIPYVDVGVKLDADGKGSINEVTGAVHYLKPGGSSLLSRKVISPEQIRADSIYRRSPEEYEQLKKEKYIKGVNVDRPAVMPINMVFSGLGVCELLSRLHNYRYDNGECAQQIIRLDEQIYTTKSDGTPCARLSRYVGYGDVNPMLDMVE